MAISLGCCWKDLRPSLSSHTLNIVKTIGYRYPTPVQEKTIPALMRSKDVVVEAVTGSGKTVAYVIPIVERLMRHCTWSSGETGAVVITPTRELATQIFEVCQTFLPDGLTARLLIGGVNVEQDVMAINSYASAIVVGTPGRLLALLSRADSKLVQQVRALVSCPNIVKPLHVSVPERTAVYLSCIERYYSHQECVVLDEADRLLELGFSQRFSVASILKYLPKQRRTALFSATLNCRVKQLITTGLRCPVTIKVLEPGRTAALPSTLNSYYLECDAERRLDGLVALLLAIETKKVIVFFATCISVVYFSSLVSSLCPQLSILTLHGRMHGRRRTVLKTFASKNNGILMCTDVAGRGIDIPAVDWVIQYDPPSSTNSFIHRSGRTARMGCSGNSLIFLTCNEKSYVEFLKLHHHLTLEPFHLASPKPNMRDCARQLISQNRSLYDMGLKSFVSFVHFYHKHECKLIFQARALDLLGHARGFALLHLPKMPELRKVDTSKFDALPSPNLPPDQKLRKNKIICEKVKRGVKRHDKTCSSHRIRKRHRTTITSDCDLEELSKDARALKKFKRGKISEAELDEVLFCS